MTAEEKQKKARREPQGGGGAPPSGGLRTSSERTLRITLVKSAIGYSQRQKDTVRALGLRRLNQSVVQEDNPVIRGMVGKVSHLVEVEEL